MSNIIFFRTVNEEEINTMNTEIKIESYVIDGYEFKGTVSNENQLFVVIICMNSDKTCYSRIKACV